jgi:pseudaminic acid cytidylyltransferase
MNIAIIPARSGSKRILNKNIRIFINKPIISYPLAQIKKSKLFDKIIVSTDSNIIAKIAKKYGADTIIKRPKNLSGDFIPTARVVAHVIKCLPIQIEKNNFVCCFYPTAVFFSFKDIIKSYNKFKKDNSNFLFSASESKSSVHRAFTINKNNNSVQMLDKKFFFKRSQDLKKTYYDVGQFYWGKVKSWLEKPVIFSNKSTIYNLPKLKVQDIDTIEDFKFAEYLYRHINK